MEVIVTSNHPTCIAVLGWGEAGSAIGTGLIEAGADVRAFDPAVDVDDRAYTASDERDAVEGAGLVLSLTTAEHGEEAMGRALDSMPAEAVWADLNTASPGYKRHLHGTARDAGRAFADVAIMAPVPGHGLRVPMLASGAGAPDAVRLLEPFGARITLQDGAAGSAAERKLLRSVFYKGLAASVVESLTAARAAGCEDWLRSNISDELSSSDARTVDRLVNGSSLHAARREHEMAAATEMLRELGVEPCVAAASRDVLAALAAGGARTHPS